MDELDPGFQALADSRRRLALFWLLRHRSLTLADLAELVTEREESADITEIADECIRDTYLSLYHTHVPQLEAAGLVRYDQESDLVARSEECAATLDRMTSELDALLESPVDEFLVNPDGGD